MTDNDVSDVLVEKVSNIERIVGMGIKTVKFIGIAFIVLLMIDIISFIIFMFIK